MLYIDKIQILELLRKQDAVRRHTTKSIPGELFKFSNKNKKYENIRIDEAVKQQQVPNIG